MKILIRALLILIVFVTKTFAVEDSKMYCKFRENFNKGYYSQVLSSNFGTQSDTSTRMKLFSIKTGVPKFLDPSKEPGINELDYFGMAPIHYFAMTRVGSADDYSCLREIGNILISLGANINMPNRYGLTPAKLAFVYGNPAAIKSFINTGKLNVDIGLLKELFSDAADPKWHPFREQILYGRANIWFVVADRWIPKEAGILIPMANFRISNLKKCIEFMATTQESFQNKSKNIRQCMQLVAPVLEAIVDLAQHTPSKKLQKVPFNQSSLPDLNPQSVSANPFRIVRRSSNILSDPAGEQPPLSDNSKPVTYQTVIQYVSNSAQNSPRITAPLKIRFRWDPKKYVNPGKSGLPAKKPKVLALKNLRIKAGI